MWCLSKESQFNLATWATTRGLDLSTRVILNDATLLLVTFFVKRHNCHGRQISLSLLTNSKAMYVLIMYVILIY